MSERTYRLLNEGEKIKKGDECDHGEPEINERWREVWASFGEVITKEEVGRFRRLVSSKKVDA